MELMEFVSLGPNCRSAMIIDQYHLKKCSYPFDWNLTNLKIINYCIKNNCVDFIDRSNYINSKNQPNCVTFKSEIFNYLDPMFVHKNPIENECDYLYTLRCVERFNNLQFIDKHIIFVYSTNNIEDLDLLNEDINELQNTLNKKYGNTKYHLLFIEIVKINDNNCLPNTYNFKIDDNNVIVLRIYIKYDINIEYDIDKAICYFFNNFNPMEEIIKEII